MRHRLWGADRIRFRIRGRDPQRYVNHVTSRGLQLDHIRWENDGCTAQGFGRDYSVLRCIAAEGGWQFFILQRHGPGRFLEACIARPGILAGVMLFVLLLNLLHRYVWVIDFGTLQGSAAERMRTLLAECGICEGGLLEEEALENAQAMALQQSDLFGWISLNFTGGCLFIENTETQTQGIREEPPMQPLYAKTDGIITAVEAESGFSCVVPGQEVTAGQMLVDIVRLDRDGREIRQGASGRILARCEETYTATYALEQTALVLEPCSVTEDTLYFLGYAWSDDQQYDVGVSPARVEWLPLRVGRLSLPGCIYRKTVWQQDTQKIQRSAEQAEALARRDCRQQLLQAFPDAKILSERCSVQTASGGVTAEVTYQFNANIAFSQQ